MLYTFTRPVHTHTKQCLTTECFMCSIHTYTHTHTHKAMLDYCFMHAILFNTLRKHSVFRLLTLRSSAQQPFKTALKRLEDETSCKFMQHHMLPNLMLKRRRFNLRKWWLCLPLTLTKTPLKKRQKKTGWRWQTLTLSRKLVFNFTLDTHLSKIFLFQFHARHSLWQKSSFFNFM